MASGGGSSGRSGFDFGTDDVLCSYDDYNNNNNIQESSSNGKQHHQQSDAPVHSTNSAKDLRESRMRRSAFLPVYNQPEEPPHQELILTVERTMKKYADNLLRFLEGISARLSQLELYCYNLEKSVGEMRSDLLRENREADSKLSSLEKHLQEVHRSIQILRDKQELADTQKELANLQLVHKESSTGSHSQHKEEVVTPSASDLQKHDSPPEVQKQQLALALPHQVNPAASPPPPPRPIEQHPSVGHSTQSAVVQSQPNYYPQQSQMPTPPMPSQHPQDRYLPADSQYQRSQLQVSQQAPQPQQSLVSQASPVHAYPTYQQQWSQQYSQNLQQQQAQQPPPPTQISSQTPPAYAPYPPPNQTVNPSPETFPGSMTMQVALSGGVRPEGVNYGYGGANRATTQQLPLQHNLPRPQQPQTNQNSYGPPLGDGSYPGSLPTQAPRQGYMMFDEEGRRTPLPMPAHFSQGVYPPPQASSLAVRHPSPSQMMRSNPYNELAEKAVSMGYGREFVASVIHSMEESGQPMDFNTLLDRLNMHSSGGPQRAWSG